MTARVPRGEFTVTHDCGFNRTCSTEAQAQSALKQHSCERQATLQRRAKWREELPTREGVKRDCQCTDIRHEHGTLQAYKIDKCKCRPCRNANNKASKTRARQIAYGTYDNGRTDLKPVRDHIIMLIENGVSDRAIAQAAGIGRTTVRTILHGRKDRGHVHKTTTKEVAAKVLALRPTVDVLSENVMVDNTGPVRRIQALVAVGWPLARIAAQIGMSPSNINTLMAQPTVRVRTAKKIRDVYDRYWDKAPDTRNNYEAGGVKRAKNMAQARGWLPPMAWDDDTMDDPATLPDLGGRQLKKDTVADDVEFLASTGAGRDEIAARLGSSWPTIERQLQRSGRANLIALVKAEARDNARHARRGHAA